MLTDINNNRRYSISIKDSAAIGYRNEATMMRMVIDMRNSKMELRKRGTAILVRVCINIILHLIRTPSGLRHVLIEVEPKLQA